MSDDEGGEDYGDYEDLGAGDEPADDEGLAEAEPEAEAEAEAEEDADADEAGLEEDAAGTDDDDEGDDEAGDEEAEPVEPATQKARPERQKVDPILRMSNKPRFVRVVAPEDRVTDNRLHKSEAALVIAMRAQQIAKYATRFTEGGALHDPVALAFKELFDRRCPFILRRPIGTGPGGEPIVEEWVVREMTLPPLTPPVPLGGGRTPSQPDRPRADAATKR
jgi:DNA-directed RNA polymerase subunit K/omega